MKTFMMKRLFAITVTAALLCACTLGPDYKRPQITAPATFQYETKDAAATADTPWWQQFQDPVLEQLIDEASIEIVPRMFGESGLALVGDLGVTHDGEAPRLADVQFDRAGTSVILRGRFVH